MGWDERPKDKNKILKAIENIRNLLNNGGRAIVTMPLAYNTEMDKMIKNGKIKFYKQYFLKRISRDNEWKQISLKEIENIKYNTPFPFANDLIIGVIKK